MRGGFDPVDHRFCPQVVGVVKYGSISNPGMETYPPRGALAKTYDPQPSAIGQWYWGFHTVRGGFDPGDHRFLSQVVGVVDVWKDF